MKMIKSLNSGDSFKLKGSKEQYTFKELREDYAACSDSEQRFKPFKPTQLVNPTPPRRAQKRKSRL